MNDFQKNIHRRDPAPYEPIRISEIEKDKKGKEEPYSGSPGAQPAKPIAFAIMVSFFKKFLNLFNAKDHSELLFFDQQQMAEDIAAFKKLLYVLSCEDQSHNPEFTQHLAQLWHNLLDDCNSILAKMPDIPANIVKLKIFIDGTCHYPSGEDHSLGYYFTEYAGKEWIPFPFLEMLQALHEECINTPHTAVLSKWIGDLAAILKLCDYHDIPSSE